MEYNFADAKRRVEDKILECFQRAERVFKNHKFTLPVLSFELDSTKIAGQANYGSNQLKINPSYLRLHTEEVINNTTPHECAHFITNKVYPYARQAHGPEFREICRVLGCKESTYHQMGRVNTLTFKYYCPRCRQEFDLTSLIHRKIQRGQHRQCVSCKTRIERKTNNTPAPAMPIAIGGVRIQEL